MQQSLFANLTAAPAEPSARPEAQLLTEALFTVIDLETTGLSAKKNGITELTAIQYRNGEEVSCYSTLVRPSEPIPPEVERMTGISNEMVAQAPDLLMVLTGLVSRMGAQPILVGHNVSFDIAFVREKLSASGLGSALEAVQISRALCTKTLAQRLLPGLPSYEGVVVGTTLGVVNRNPHRAEADVRMAAGILFALIDRLKTSHPDVKTVADLLALQGPLRSKE